MNTDEMERQARAWAESLGGEMPVELWCWVTVNGPIVRKNYLARIGDSCASSPSWTGSGKSLAEAMANAEKSWTKAGSPGLEEAELHALRDRAAKLGYRLEKTAEPKLDQATETVLANEA